MAIDLLRKNNLLYLQSPMLDALGAVRHAFSTRCGGCSSGAVSSLNMAFHTEDCEANVLENRRRFFCLFNHEFRDIVSAVQVHGAELVTVDARNRGEGAVPGTSLTHYDALITIEPDLALAAYAADCMLIFFAALDFPLVAVAHAGREGTCSGIAKKVFRHISESYNVSPQRIAAAFSPSICKNCYTVDDAAAARFADAGWFGSRYLEPCEEGRWKIDLAEINASQLLKAGIDQRHLSRSTLCTSCRDDLFYSYRRDKGKTGRMLGFIKIEKQGEKRFEQ